MIRGYTETGSEFIGLVRAQVDRLLAGERVCLPSHTDANGVRYPHVCLFFRETNAEVIEAGRDLFPDGFLPGAPIEHVSAKEP